MESKSTDTNTDTQTEQFDYLFKKSILKYRWLSGDEYYYILTNFNHLRKIHNLQIYEKNPPKWIYKKPKNGVIFFINNLKLENLTFQSYSGIQQFYKWKKMNFPTFIPKKNSKIMYMVATCKEDDRCYRMHIVQLSTYENEINRSVYTEKANLTLCQMLQIEPDSYTYSNGIRRRKIPKPLMQIKKVEEKKEFEETLVDENNGYTLKYEPNNKIHTACAKPIEKDIVLQQIVESYKNQQILTQKIIRQNNDLNQKQMRKRQDNQYQYVEKNYKQQQLHQKQNKLIQMQQQNVERPEQIKQTHCTYSIQSLDLNFVKNKCDLSLPKTLMFSTYEDPYIYSSRSIKMSDIL